MNDNIADCSYTLSCRGPVEEYKEVYNESNDFDVVVKCRTAEQDDVMGIPLCEEPKETTAVVATPPMIELPRTGGEGFSFNLMFVFLVLYTFIFLSSLKIKI